jgi:hypothetical protein
MEILFEPLIAGIKLKPRHYHPVAMPDADERLTPADPADLADEIAFALRYSGRKRVHQGDEYEYRSGVDAHWPFPSGVRRMRLVQEGRGLHSDPRRRCEPGDVLEGSIHGASIVKFEPLD